MLKKNLISCTVTAALVMLSGCQSMMYKPSVQQGNLITQQQMHQLHRGTTRAQVVTVLGAPLLIHTPKSNELIYTYTFAKRNQPVQVKLLKVYFKKERMTRYSFTSITKPN